MKVRLCAKRGSDLGGDDIDGEAEEHVEEVKRGGDGPPCPAVPLARSEEAAPSGGWAFESDRSVPHLWRERCLSAPFVCEEQCLRLWLGCS